MKKNVKVLVAKEKHVLKITTNNFWWIEQKLLIPFTTPSSSPGSQSVNLGSLMF